MFDKYCRMNYESNSRNNSSSIGELLSRIVKQTNSQATKKANGRRFEDQVLKKFAVNLWIMGGRRCYEILQSNLLGVLPSSQTIHHEMAKYQMPVVDGILLFKSIKM
jgi:hypothetical protein